MNNFLSKYPNKQTLLKLFREMEYKEVNAHIHTPYSFSAFRDIKQIFEMAVNEKISALGINDFYVTDGYEAFHNEAVKNKIFPLFNIEFISLLKEEQTKGIRINDPDNPGRCYFSGKGLDFPFVPQKKVSEKMSSLLNENLKQVKKMTEKCNAWLKAVNSQISIDFDEIKERYAEDLVRERHIAKALRIAVYKKAETDNDRKDLLRLIFEGKEPVADLSDIPGVENEIRSRLLKSGGKAFVKEDDSAFPALEEVMEIITLSGGIPCYPVLLDDKNGNITEFESDPQKLHKTLISKGIHCMELIPGRNSPEELENFVRWFHEKDFIILMGTEHNTPLLTPLRCDTRDKKPLNPYIKQVSYEGACMVAAHQYLRANGEEGLLANGEINTSKDKNSMLTLGNAVISYTNKNQ